MSDAQDCGATIGSANAAPAAQPSIPHHRHHGTQVLHRHSLYNYYNTSPVLPRPDCYLPSDGCPNDEESVCRLTFCGNKNSWPLTLNRMHARHVEDDGHEREI